MEYGQRTRTAEHTACRENQGRADSFYGRISSRSDTLIREKARSVQLLSHIFDSGTVVYEQIARSFPFRVAVRRFLASRSDHRCRSYQECASILGRLLAVSNQLAATYVCCLNPDDCAFLLEMAFHTAATTDKARRILHCFFRYAEQEGWCSGNPVAPLRVCANEEARVAVLSLEQVRQLLEASLLPQNLPCAPAVGMMLWAGIRPAEVARLSWRDVNLAEREIYVSPRHSKTGGARVVSIMPVLYQWLRKFRAARAVSPRIVPASWAERWRTLREWAGMTPWRADTLRHTFASYHLKLFGNLGILQQEMGHSESRLLRTRYLNMSGFTREDAAKFWNLDALLNRKYAETAMNGKELTCTAPYFIA